MKKNEKHKKRPLPGKVFPYKITYEPFDKYPGDDNNQIRSLIEKYFYMCKKSPKKAVRELRRVIEQFPDIVEFYNYLFIGSKLAYGEKESLKVIQMTLEKFPDYLFAKLDLANLLLNRGELEKIPGVLDNKFDLKQMYPEREVFHISEAKAFLFTMVHYYTLLKNFGAANKYFSQLESIAPDDPLLEEIEEVIFESILEEKIRHFL